MEAIKIMLLVFIVAMLGFSWGYLSITESDYCDDQFNEKSYIEGALLGCLDGCLSTFNISYDECSDRCNEITDIIR